MKHTPWKEGVLAWGNFMSKGRIMKNSDKYFYNFFDKELVILFKSTIMKHNA